MSLVQELVSIIMAAYNAEKTLSQAVDSVLCQTYPYFELLIINDGSTDSTAKIAAAYAMRDTRIRLINNPANCGISQTRLNGALAAKGNWIAVLDSDDVWTPDKLEKQFTYQQKTGARFLFTGSAFMNADGNPLDWQMHVPLRVNYKDLLKQNIISNSSILIEKELYLEHYVSDDNLHEDFAAWLSVLKSGIIAHGIDEPLLIYRLSSSSRSGNKQRSAVLTWNVYRRAGLSTCSSLYCMVFYTINGIKKYRHLK